MHVIDRYIGYIDILFYICIYIKYKSILRIDFFTCVFETQTETHLTALE